MKVSPMILRFSSGFVVWQSRPVCTLAELGFVRSTGTSVDPDENWCHAFSTVNKIQIQHVVWMIKLERRLKLQSTHVITNRKGLGKFLHTNQGLIHWTYKNVHKFESYFRQNTCLMYFVLSQLNNYSQLSL